MTALFYEHLSRLDAIAPVKAASQMPDERRSCPEAFVEDLLSNYISLFRRLLLTSFTPTGEKEIIMSAKEGRTEEREDQNAGAEKSPTEKLEGKQPPGSTVPGAQNPESKEIKNEINPNTE
jgi:hypothetical protein